MRTIRTISHMTMHMAIAGYLSDSPDEQVVRMAKRYKRDCMDPKTRRTLKKIINSPKPKVLVHTVYHETVKRSEDNALARKNHELRKASHKGWYPYVPV